MNFMGIGTGELIVILIIAVLVVGPDKMVDLAGKLGRLFVKVRQMTDGATNEFRDALAIDEIKDAIQGVSDEVKDIGQEVKGTADDVAKIGADARGAVQDAQDVAIGKPVAPVKPTTTGTVPQVILDMMGPVTQTAATGASSTDTVPPDASNHGDSDAEPVKVQATTIAVEEQDEEPIELDDVIVVESASDNHQATTGSAS